jgi:hypothetical protein
MDELIQWPNEMPCLNCGWPMYCCLCPADDQCIQCGDFPDKLNEFQQCEKCAQAERETDLYHSYDILGLS